MNLNISCDDATRCLDNALYINNPLTGSSVVAIFSHGGITAGCFAICICAKTIFQVSNDLLALRVLHWFSPGDDGQCTKRLPWQPPKCAREYGWVWPALARRTTHPYPSRDGAFWVFVSVENGSNCFGRMLMLASIVTLFVRSRRPSPRGLESARKRY